MSDLAACGQLESVARGQPVHLCNLILELHCLLISQCNPNLQNSGQCSTQTYLKDAQVDLELLYSHMHIAKRDKNTTLVHVCSCVLTCSPIKIV